MNWSGAYHFVASLCFRLSHEYPDLSHSHDTFRVFSLREKCQQPTASVVSELVNCLPFFKWIHIFFMGDFFGYFFLYDIQHYFICRPSDSTMSEDAGIEPRIVATMALAVRRFNHSARSHPPLCRRCCYNKVDSVMAESQNWFSSYKSSIH